MDSENKNTHHVKELYAQRFSQEDLDSVINLVEERGLKKIFITGDIKTGKSKFCNEFVEKVNGCLFIELDKERDKRKGETRNEVLDRIIKENKNNFYILDHYGLLQENYICDKKNSNTLGVWKKEADILILLNPKAHCDIGSTQKNDFDKLDGEIIYCNLETGTYVKSII